MSTKAIEALREAACSLLTIAANAGRKKDSEGQENHLQHDDQVRGYARNRANVAFAALAELEAEQAQSGWQPIETAPKDRTVLLWSRDLGRSSVTGHHVTANIWAAYAPGVPILFQKHIDHPTHWMPLPPPPAAMAAKQESKHD